MKYIVLLVSFFVMTSSTLFANKEQKVKERLEFLKKRIKFDRLSPEMQKRMNEMIERGEYIPNEATNKELIKIRSERKKALEKKKEILQAEKVPKEGNSKQKEITIKPEISLEEYFNVNKDFYAEKKDILSIHRKLYLNFYVSKKIGTKKP